MNAWWILSCPAMLFLAITAAARLDDLGRDSWRFRHHVRRLGLIGVGFWAGSLLIAPFTLQWREVFPTNDVATWRTFVVTWAWTCVWLTTPNMVPWYDFILGVHREHTEWRDLTWRQRAISEWRALRNSFTPMRRRIPLDPDLPPEPRHREDA